MQSCSLLFPIRYPSNGKIVGLKRASVDPETGEIFEENLPREKELSALQVSEGMTQNLLRKLIRLSHIFYPYFVYVLCVLFKKNALLFLGKPWIHRIFPLPHGLDRAHKSNSSSVILVTSILDALALSAHTNVVTLADGAGNLPPEHLSFLEKFSQIIFW